MSARGRAVATGRVGLVLGSVVLLALVIGLAVFAAGPARAETSPRGPLGSIPPAGAELDEVPPFVRVVFGEPVELVDEGIWVQDADGARVDLGDGALGASPAVLEVSLPSSLEPGTYEAGWDVAFADGETHQGSLMFTVTSAAAGEDVGLWDRVGLRGLLIAAVVAVAAAGIALRVLSSRQDEPAPLDERP